MDWLAALLVQRDGVFHCTAPTQLRTSLWHIKLQRLAARLVVQRFAPCGFSAK